MDIKFASCYIKKKYGRELPDLVIAVDRGLEGVKQLGILPHILLGDYDSVKSEVLKEYEEVSQVTCLRYPPEKDYTDSHLAIEKIGRLITYHEEKVDEQTLSRAPVLEKSLESEA